MFNKLVFNKTGRLTQFVLKRDRYRLLVWIGMILFFTMMVAAAFPGLFPTEVDRQSIAVMMENPAMVAFIGPAFSLDNYTYGAMFAHEMMIFTAMAIAIMNILLFTRHTRGDEEEGRVEMVRSLPVGRLANLTAVIIELTVVNVLLFLILGFGLPLFRIESMHLSGSLLFGAALAAFGLFFMAITAVFAQLTETSKGTLSYSFGVLFITYLIRAIGDVSFQTLSWLSPYTWMFYTKPYVDHNWWLLLLTLVLTIGLVLLAFYINAKRDLGSGLLPTKPGKRHATKLLKHPLGLAFRLERTTIIVWLIAMFILGATYGSVFGDIETFFDTSGLSDILPDVDGYSLAEQFLALIMLVMAIVSTVPVLNLLLKVKGEEKRNRIENLLTLPVSREKVLGSYISLSLMMALLTTLMTGLGLYVASFQSMDEPFGFGTILASASIYLPAIIVMIGLTTLFLGLNPKISYISWLYLFYAFFTGYLGNLLNVPEGTKKLTPFGLTSQLPIEDVHWVRMSVLLVLGILLIILGFNRYRNRDIKGE